MMVAKRSVCTQSVFTTSLERKSICVSLLHTLCSVLWLDGAVKGSLALKAVARDQPPPPPDSGVGVWMG